jgi:KaiC/GvpD/RAD55 family RecA-like ATPase
MSRVRREKRDPAHVTAAEFISALLPPTPAVPALGEPCIVVSSPFTPKGEDTRQWPPIAYHEGASYAPELYVNWALCKVVEYTDRNGTVKQGPRATNAAFDGQYFLMLDDVGNPEKSRLTLNSPEVLAATYVMETSEGNFQVGYAFAEPLDATESARLRAALVVAKLGDAGSLKSPHRWCRVPGSMNTKPEKKGWKSVLHEWHPERIYTLADLCELLDIFLDSSVQAPAGGTVEMPADIDKYNDAHFRWLRTLPRGAPGSIIESRRSTGFFPIICPWHEEHTHGKDGAAYRPGFGDSPPAFNCHHSHEPKYTTGDFLGWCIEQQRGSPDEPEIAPIPDDEFWNYDDVLNAAYPDWLIEELFARRQVGAIFGEPYAGKSVLAFAITMALAGGADTLGDLDQWESDVGAVYFALEGNLRTRTEPYKRENMLEGAPRIRFERGLELELAQQDGFTKIATLLKRAKELDPRTALVVIDTLARASGVDENTADMGKIAELLRQIAEENDVCILIVHHSGKDQSKGLRGHSSFFAALDFAIEVQVEKNQDGKALRRTFSVTKQRDGEGNVVREFEIRGVELGRHPKRPGKRVSGPLCLIKAGEAKKATPKLTAPKGKVQRSVYETLRWTLHKASRHVEARQTARGWGIPTTTLAAIAADRLPKPQGHDRRREVAHRALQALGLDNWLWYTEEGGEQYVLDAAGGDE